MKYDFAKAELRMRELNEKLSKSECENREALEAEFAQLQREYSMYAAIEKRAKEQQETQDFCLTKALREAHKNRQELNVREAITASGVTATAVETQMQTILEPLYANSVLSQVGTRHFNGLPMGNISVPVLGKGNAFWTGENGASQDGGAGLKNNIVLKPHRLTAYFEISEQMLQQDTVGVNQALLRDAVSAIKDKFEATIFGSEAGTDDKPAGIFYGKTAKAVKDFAAVTELESDVENANVNGACKYVLSTKAKADLRNMAKSAKSTQLVMEGGTVDGTPAISTTLIASSASEAPYVYGDFSNLITAAWGDLILKVDDSVNYANGMIRIYVTGYFDAKVGREEAFVYGDTRKSV